MTKEQTPEEVISNETNYLQSEKNKYEKGFNILMEYFDSISEEERESVDRRLSNLGL